jgi:ATP-binding cassette subfamily B protein
MDQSRAEPKVAVSSRQYARFLRHYLRPHRALVSALGVALSVSIGLQLLNPQILRVFIDTARAGGASSVLTRLALTFIGVAVVQQLTGVLVVYITENLGWATTNTLRLELAAHCLGLDMSFHAAHTPGEMIERIDGDVMALSNFFSQFILQVFGNLLLVVGILIVLTGVNWLVSLSLGTFVLLTMIVLLRLANISVPAWEAERQASAGLFGFLEERLAGTEDIRSNHAAAYVLDRFYRLTRDLMRKTIRAGLKLNILLNTTWVLFAVGNAVALVVSATLYASQAITLGTVYMIMYYTNMLTWPLERITQQMQDLQKAGASLVRIMNLEAISGRIPGEENFALPARPQLQPGPLAVEFANVTFGYDDSAAVLPRVPPLSDAQGLATAGADGHLTPPSSAGEPAIVEKETVLRDVSFRIAPGRVLGLLGRTGSGKTTLTRLLFRLYDPDQGSIGLGEEGCPQDIRQLSIQELRHRVGMVTQNIQLFHASIRENLTFFDAGISDERILEAIRDLGLWEWYVTLPKGLDTELESGGAGLSAGEAQMLAFTRIFLRDPGLVILDEATSRLDPATEYLIEQAVDKLVRDRTAIIVAHRLGTVQRADDILILEDGQVREYGERAHLVRHPDSRFAQLLQTGLQEVLA